MRSIGPGDFKQIIKTYRWSTAMKTVHKSCTQLNDGAEQHILYFFKRSISETAQYKSIQIFDSLTLWGQAIFWSSIDIVLVSNIIKFCSKNPNTSRDKWKIFHKLNLFFFYSKLYGALIIKWRPPDIIFFLPWRYSASVLSYTSNQNYMPLKEC